MARYNYIEDFKGVKSLLELGGTATYNLTAFHGIRIKPSEDCDRIFYQYVSDKGPQEIYEADIEYFGPEQEILDLLNVDEEEFEEEYGSVAGFYIDGEIYLLQEFLLDDY